MRYLIIALTIGIVSCGGNIPRSKYLSDSCFDYDSCKQSCLYHGEKKACSVYLEIETHYKGNKFNR